jgi:hypothetical protein
MISESYDLNYSLLLSTTPEGAQEGTRRHNVRHRPTLVGTKVQAYTFVAARGTPLWGRKGTLVGATPLHVREMPTSMLGVLNYSCEPYDL